MWSAAFADAGDPPARVARLNYMSGSVSFRPANVEEWAPATLNYPLTVGDRLWADDGAGVEMHIGAAAVRMASQTAVEFLNVDDRVAQLSLQQGALDIRVVSLESGETFEIDTPNGAVTLLSAGQYRIDVTPNDNATYVTVRNGEAEISGAGNPFPLHQGQMAHIFGDPAGAEITEARPPDGWEQWCMDRDRSEDQAAAASMQYVPRDMIGAEDLGNSGDWRQEPEYGPVWVPRVPAGWAPYQNGHWAWVDPWGWTWIDDAPWGFAPFHYGRWAFVGGVWVWAPGARVVRPVYAPALVVFVGSGPNVAWFPLGPREPFIPAYRVSQTYVRQVNITHVNATNINVVNVRYVNREVPGAVMAVPQHAFVSARPVRQVSVTISRDEIHRAEVVRTVPVAPSREARLGRTPSGMVRTPPARVMERGVVAKSAPPRGVSPAVRQIQPVERRGPTRIEAGQPVVTAPGPGRPAAVERPRMERPAAVQPPARPERPAEVARPREVERPAAVQPPARTERPARTEQRQEPQMRREAQPERRPEPQVRTEEKREESKAHKNESRKDEKKREQQ
jgi:hypothetical protein